MSKSKYILEQLKTKEIRIEANKEIIRKIIKEEFGYELPLAPDTYMSVSDANRNKLIQMVNVLFEALAEAVEDTRSEYK